MRVVSMLVGGSVCVLFAAFGCSSASSGSGGSGGGASSSASGKSSSSSASSSASSSSASGTSGSSSSSGGGLGAACNDCSGKLFMMDMNCKASLDACKADMDCALWLGCTQNCLMTDPTTMCFAACDQAESAVNNLYQPIYDCICAVNTCKAQCSFACP